MTGARSAKPSRGRRRWSAVSLLGLVLLLIGLGILGWAGWQYYGTNITSHREANKAVSQLEQRWSNERAQAKANPKAKQAPAVPTLTGDVMALIRIPDLGKDWVYPVIAGTTPDVLAEGVGWYTRTALPGQVGNFAVAAHRVTHGEPFRHLLELDKGAVVTIETRDAVYTYELDNAPRTLTVQDTDGWVIEPVPGKPSAKPTQALLTMTTCQDLFHSPNRSVAFGHLVKTVKK